MQVAIQTDPVTVPPSYVAGIGTEPNNCFPPGTTDADLGPGYHIVDLADDQIGVVAANLYCYLSADGLSLYGGPQPA